MTAFHRHSFTLALSFLFFPFVITSITARPIITSYRSDDLRRFPYTLNTVTTVLPRNINDTQTIEAVQVFTTPGGNTAEICTLIQQPTTLSNGDVVVVFSRNCPFSFPPSSRPQATTVAVTISSDFRTTLTADQTPRSTRSLSNSRLTTAAFPTPTSTPAFSPLPSETLGNTIASSTEVITTSNLLTSTVIPTHLNDSASPSSSQDSPFVSFASSGHPASSTSSSGSLSSAAQGHLPSLPIFLGAFGGLAILALLVIGFKVYKPLQRFHEARLNPTGFMNRLKARFTTGIWSGKPPQSTVRSDSEKLTGRQSQETVDQISSGSSTNEQVSQWIS
ncbi:hypothetical protein K439DRAFT_1663700 [Ramaria rubella]|nr:hypothetical protein K439DRAFT_1663700 [Ramaria rubella]